MTTKIALTFAALALTIGMSACAAPAAVTIPTPKPTALSFDTEQVDPTPTLAPVAPVEVAPTAPLADETEIIPPNSLPAGSAVPFQNGKFDTGACASGTAYVEADGSGVCVD